MDGFKLRFISLGGVVGVNKNLYVYELHKGNDLQDILLVDCGIGFPDDKTLGVDFLIPDVSYLRDKLPKVRGIIISHGHYDHFAALPYVYNDIGAPMIYTNKLTAAFIRTHFKEFGITPKITQVKFDQELKLGPFTIDFIHMTHSVQDTMHFIIKTPVGNLYHGTDFKLDLNPPYERPPDFHKITRAGKEGLLCLMSDCIGVETEGLTLSESAVGETFENEMRKTRGKFIMTTFSTNISRIRQCFEVATKLGRKVAFLGRSMKQNTQVASEIGYLPVPRESLLKEDEVMKVPPNKVCIIVTGSQGEYRSGLSKLAIDQNRFVKIKPGDKIVFSADPIPGNESDVYSLIEELTLKGADVVYSDIKEQLHASGHGNQEDLKFLVRFTNPKYFIPIGGTVRHQKQYSRMVEGLGYERESVFMLDEGDSVWFEKGIARTGQSIETKNIYVDASGVGDVGTVVLRDRKTISSEGILVTVLILDKNGRMTSPPRLISRGFVFEKKEENLFREAEKIISNVLKPRSGRVLDFNLIRRQVIDELETFFSEQRGRSPLIIVDIVQI